MSVQNNSSFMMTVFIVLGVGAVIIALIIILCVTNARKNRLVEANSPYIKEVKLVNSKYKFDNLGNTKEKVVQHLKSKRQFDSFNYRKFFETYVKNHESKYSRIVASISKNIMLRDNYLNELRSIKNTSDSNIANECKMSLASFVKRENKIATKYIVHPVISFYLMLHWEYTSPAGRNHYSNKYQFNFDDIKRVINAIKPIKQPRVSKPEKAEERDEPGTISYDDLEEILD